MRKIYLKTTKKTETKNLANKRFCVTLKILNRKIEKKLGK